MLKTSFLAALTVGFAVAVPMAYALTNSTSFVNTGDDAVIDTEAEVETDVNVTNSNTATVTQSVVSNANTGNNTANGGIGGSSITTGQALVGAGVSANTNSNLTALEFGGSNLASNLTDIVNTGDDAQVETETEIETDATVNNTNNANITQAVVSNANSGFNEANDGIGGASIRSGNANILSELDVDANHNTTLFDFGYWGNGQGLLNDTMITNTGDNLDVESEAEMETNVNVANFNTMTSLQSIVANANSGYNESNGGIGGAGIVSGSAAIASAMSAAGNTNLTGIGGSGLGPASSNLSDIVNTGDDLELESETEVETDITTTGTNTFVGTQTYVLSSNSGFNETTQGIGGSSILSNGAGTSALMSTDANHNSTVFGMLGLLLNMLAL